MALIFPENREEVSDRAKTDVQAALPESNPFLANSYLCALIVGYAGRIFDFYLQLQELVRQIFPDTATEDFLIRWGTYVGITRNPATGAAGNIVATGTTGITIPGATVLASKDGRLYNVDNNVTIANNSVGLLSVIRSGSTVICQAAADIQFASGQEINISGLNETEYNGDFVIQVTDTDTFTYEIDTFPTTPATGAGVAQSDMAVVPVTSQGVGQIVNLASGEEVVFQTPLAGVDESGFTSFGQVAGGTDEESDDELRDRIIDRYANPVANFNVAKIETTARAVAGVTRVFIDQACENVKTVTLSSLTMPSNGIARAETATNHEIQDCFSINVTGANEPDYNVSEKRVIDVDDTTFAYAINPLAPPAATGTIEVEVVIAPGTLRVFFMRDNDADPIPSASELQQVKDAILAITPGHTDQKDVLVLAPVAVPVDFTIDGLLPNTSTMQAAIIDSLEILFQEGTAVGDGLRRVEYECAIQNTIDLTSLDTVQDFTLVTPTTDLAVNDGEILTLGTVTFT